MAPVPCSYGYALTTNGAGSNLRQMSLWGWCPQARVSVPMKEGLRGLACYLTYSPCTRRRSCRLTMQGAGCLQTRKDPQQNPPLEHADCRFLTSRILRKQVCCLNSPCLYLLNKVSKSTGQALDDFTLTLSVSCFCVVAVDLMLRNAMTFIMSIISCLKYSVISQKVLKNNWEIMLW